MESGPTGLSMGVGYGEELMATHTSESGSIPRRRAMECIPGRMVGGDNGVGDRYEGEWQACLKHGEGTDIFANGDIYVGNYKFGRED